MQRSVANRAFRSACSRRFFLPQSSVCSLQLHSPSVSLHSCTQLSGLLAPYPDALTESRRHTKFFRVPKADSAEASANRTSIKLQIRGFISFIVGIFVCFAYIEYKKKEKHEKKKLRRQKEIVVHTDPHMKGSAARLGLHKGCWLPVVLFPDDQLLDDIWEFSLRSDDVIVCSFPKSGTTWLQEIVYLIMNDLDVRKAQSANIEERFPYIEYVYPGLKDLSKLKGQRLMKSHLPYHHLPHEVMEGKSKILYIARNPKDVTVSYYYFAKMFRESSYTGTIDNFSDSFLAGQVPYGPWVIHVQEFHEMAKMKRNVMFIMYEDLKENPEKVITQIANFLGKDLTPEQISGIAKYCAFDNMKKNPAANYSWWEEYGLRNKNSTPFLRKGDVGDWKNHLSVGMSKEFDLHLQSWFGANGSLNFREHLPEKKK